ncbi:MAG: YggT family protein [Candidatus Paceibacterota bacterium]
MENDSTKSLYKGVQIVWYALYLIEGLLAIRFVLKLLSANPEAVFTDIIYTVSGVFVWPFLAVFSDIAIAGNTFEWTTLLAMFVYWLLAMAIIKLFVMNKSVSKSEADERLSQEEY